MKNLIICSAIFMLAFTGCKEKDEFYDTNILFQNNTGWSLKVYTSNSYEYEDALKEVFSIKPGSYYNPAVSSKDGFWEFSRLWNTYWGEDNVIMIISNGEKRIVYSKKDNDGVYNTDNYTVNDLNEKKRVYHFYIKPEMFDNAEPID